MGFQKGAIRYGTRILFGKKILSGVPAIIKNPKGEILLGKRKKNMFFYPEMWGLPGGIIEFGETVEEAIKRELEEELGVKSEITKYGKPFMQMPVKECPVQSLNLPVYCKINGTPQAKDETSEIKWFKPKEIKSMKLAYSHKEILEIEKII
jgi:mutator protein MutT